MKPNNFADKTAYRFGRTAFSFIILAGTLWPTDSSAQQVADSAENFSLTGFAGLSAAAGIYKKTGKDLYAVADNLVTIKYKECRADLSIPDEPLSGPPDTGNYKIHLMEILGDCSWNETHFLFGRFPYLSYGDISPLLGLDDGGRTIGNYDVFRRSPVFQQGLPNQDGVGMVRDIGSDSSIVARITRDDSYFGLKGDHKLTYSTDFNMKWENINGSLGFAHIGPLDENRISFSLNGEKKIDPFDFQAAAIILLRQTRYGMKEDWQSAAGIVGDMGENWRWKTGFGFMGETNNAAAYGFVGSNYKITSGLSVAITLSHVEPLRNSLPQSELNITRSNTFMITLTHDF